MTGYSSSSTASREHMSARERTAYWVHAHSPDQVECYSPSVPPPELDAFFPSPPSDAGSSHSVPPKMVLRYDDGRPDIPIPYPDARYGPSRSHRRSHYNPQQAHVRERAGSHASPLLVEVHSRGHRGHFPTEVPEEIRVLPSARAFQSQQGRNARSRSLPRSDGQPTGNELRTQPVPYQTHATHPVSGSYAQDPAQVPRGAPPRTHVLHAHGGPWHQRSGGHAQPSSMPHAPVPHPALYVASNGYYHPPQVGPNGVIYSHSAPVGSGRHGQPYQHVAAPDYRHAMQGDHTRGERPTDPRSRSVSLSGPAANAARPLVINRSNSSLSGSELGANYYVTRSRGSSKGLILTPSPGLSVKTATSSSHSPTTPSSAMSGKRPFFQRLFHIAGKRSHGGTPKTSSAADGDNFYTRRSTDGPHRVRSPEIRQH
ncbi:hypothetical protein AX17_003869 [Amanita inopinata Kibby_2008]|nr:hypothetical protein AX17_003869 [Amanita inopinata Kibby_2008]